MGDKEEMEAWDILKEFEKWKSGNDSIDKAVFQLICHSSNKEAERASQRLIKIGEAAVPTILNALIDRETTWAGFTFFAGYCERNILPLRTLGAIGSPLAFPVLHKIYKVAHKEKMDSSGVPEHRHLFYNLEDALHKCDHRWWKKLFHSHH